MIIKIRLKNTNVANYNLEFALFSSKIAQKYLYSVVYFINSKSSQFANYSIEK